MAYRGSRGIAPLILKHGIRRVESIQPHVPPTVPLGREPPMPTEQHLLGSEPDDPSHSLVTTPNTTSLLSICMTQHKK